MHIILSLMKNMTDEKSQKLAIKFLDKIDFANDLEQTLSFYG